MLTAEFPQFETEMRRLEKLFGKTIDDELMQSYWFALKDQQFGVFKRFVERHEKHGKYFPKPADLRSKEDRLPEVEGGKDDATFREGESRCIRNLEHLRGADPIRFKREIHMRYLDRLISKEHPGSSIFEAASTEWHQLRSQP